MTFSEFRLKRLTIDSFRGIRDECEFDLDATSVIFSGPNGTGKTSVFDALQWVMLGTIRRLEGLRGRKNVEHIVNTYRLGGRASVALDILADGIPMTMRRKGHYGESTLEIAGAAGPALFGQEAENWLGANLVPHDPKALPMFLTTCGLLQQDVMRSVLEAKASDRYAHIGVILGLGELEAFEYVVRDAAKEAKKRRDLARTHVDSSSAVVQSAGIQVETVGQRAAQRASVEVVRTMLRDTIQQAPSGARIDVPDILTAEHARKVAGGCRALRQDINALLETATTLRHQMGLLATEPDPDMLELLNQAIEEAVVAVRTAEVEEHNAAAALALAEKTSEQLDQLAAIAIPLLTDHCPVCRQSIDPVEVERFLLGGDTESTSLLDFRNLVDNASDKARRAREREQALQNEYRSAREVAAEWERVRENERTLREQVDTLTGDAKGAITLEPAPDAIELWGPETIKFLDNLASVLETYCDTLMESQAIGELVRAESRLQNARSALEERVIASKRMALQAARLEELSEAVKRARVEVTTARFAAIEPLVTDIYSRLDPHPTFKSIGFKHDMYYGKGTSSPFVSDVSADVEADPLIVFSASQANIAALSYFLAMSLGAGERALPFVLMDDPLQSMDDVNVLGFADLCRFVRAERQLLLSTHDRRFANLLRRKLAPRDRRDRTVIHRFTGWDRRGPSVVTDVLGYEPRSAELRLVNRSA